MNLRQRIAEWVYREIVGESARQQQDTADADERIGRVRADADERLYRVKADADERLNRVRTDADERLEKVQARQRLLEYERDVLQRQRNEEANAQRKC